MLITYESSPSQNSEELTNHLKERRFEAVDLRQKTNSNEKISNIKVFVGDQEMSPELTSDS